MSLKRFNALFVVTFTLADRKKDLIFMDMLKFFFCHSTFFGIDKFVPAKNVTYTLPGARNLSLGTRLK